VIVLNVVGGPTGDDMRVEDPELIAILRLVGGVVGEASSLKLEKEDEDG